MTVRIEFVKSETTRYRSLLYRADGVTIEFEGGSYNKVGGRPDVVPHDLAHLIVEDELGLTRGVWGVLAAGALFRHARVIAGRQKPHASTRGRAIVEAAGEQIMQAEILTRAVCDVARGTLPPEVAALRHAIGDRWWNDGVSEDVLARCLRRLRDGAAAWAALPAAGTLAAEWAHPVDAALIARR